MRIVHLGLGNFHRAHQAWYTARASDGHDWGIAAFTGRTPAAAIRSNAQDGLYSLVVRGAEHDEVHVVGSIIEAVDGSRVDRLAEFLSSSDVSIVTLTITEAGYGLDPRGRPDPDAPDIAADIEEIRRHGASGSLEGARPRTALARLLVALDARRRRNGPALAVVPCDNIPGNGSVVARVMRMLALAAPAELASWVDTHVSFVSTSIDRITPRVHPPVQASLDAGWIDDDPVVTEPFSDWVLQGDFPTGRPLWESAGARFVDDIAPWEARKLWLLNGAHSLLSLMGLVRGYVTVAQAMDDADCLAAVEEFWNEAVGHLPSGIEHRDYRDALRDRFRNRRIEHRLTQIADDVGTKVRFRFAPVAERTIAVGGDARGSAGAIAAWIVAMEHGVVPELPASPTDRPGGLVVSAIATISSSLSADHGFVALVREAHRRSSHQAETAILPHIQVPSSA